MYILSADTTAKTASVCVSQFENGACVLLSEINVNKTRTHSESLLPMIDECLSYAGLDLSAIGVFAVSAGPGSFTGVRIGISTFKGLTFDRDDALCVPVSALEALAENLSSYPDGTILCPLMDARRDQFYNALFEIRNGKPARLCEDRLESFEKIYSELSNEYAGRDIIINGEGAPIFHDLLKGASSNIVTARAEMLYQHAFSVAICAAKTLAHMDEDEKKKLSSSALLPKYLRASQAEREREEKNNCK